MAGKAARSRIRRWGQSPESVGERPHLSGARGVGQVLQDAFDFELEFDHIYNGNVVGAIF